MRITKEVHGWFNRNAELEYWCLDCGEKFVQSNAPKYCYVCRSHDRFHKQSNLSYYVGKVLPGYARVNDTINTAWYGGLKQTKDWLVYRFLGREYLG